MAAVAMLCGGDIDGDGGGDAFNAGDGDGDDSGGFNAGDGDGDDGGDGDGDDRSSTGVCHLCIHLAHMLWLVWISSMLRSNNLTASTPIRV